MWVPIALKTEEINRAKLVSTATSICDTGFDPMLKSSLTHRRLGTAALMLVFGSVAGPSALAQAAPKNPKQKTVYTVATAHLDTNWLWTIQDTIRDHLPKTMNVNFQYFKDYPDYNFNFEGAFHYMLMKEYYPEQYAKLKEFVKQGRWNVAGSWVDAVDPNMPSPESMFRQALYGNGFFKKEFNKTSVDVFLPDCFGFSYALPSIAVHSGLKGFSTQKLTWGSASGIPFPVGVWEGVDGSQLIAAFDPGSYGGSIPADMASNPGILRRVNTLGDKSGVYVDYRYHGTGDTGGGPKEESVQNLEKNMHANGPLKVLSSSTDQFYRDLTPEQISYLPKYKGELLLTTHGTGCYTAQAAMKMWNRENERLASAAERAAVIADWLGGASYPHEKLNAAWVRFLWHQFHDDLTGTCIPQVYPFSWNDEVISLNQFSEVLQNSVSVIAAGMDTQTQGIPLIVYNALDTQREDVVESSVDFGAVAPENVRVFGPDGTEVPSQVTGKDGSIVHFLFLAKAGPVSTSTYEVRASSTPTDLATGLKVTEAGLENGRYRVAINDAGDVSSIFDKQVNKELLKSPIRLEMRDDDSPDWPAWEVKYPVILGAPREYVSGPAKVRIVENGAARVAIEVERTTNGSTFTQRIQLSAGEGARVEFPTKVDWRSKGTLLKVDFNLTAAAPFATYDLGLGTIERGNDTPQKYEVPAQQWADLSNADRAFGATITSDSKYGWDKPSDDHLRLTLIHTPRPARGYRYQETNDLGHHDFTFALVGHRGDWRGETGRNAARLNQPLLAFTTNRHAGQYGRVLQFAQVDNDSIKIDSIKKAENSIETIVRVFERRGQPLFTGSLTFGAPIAKVREVNGVENAVPSAGSMSVNGNHLNFSLKAYQPRSFAITFAKAPTMVAKAKSTPVALPYDVNVVTKRGEATATGFNGKGDAIPAELFPSGTETEGVAFNFGPANKSNAVTGKGQTIELGSGQYTRVYVLAASAGDDTTATFGLGLTNVKVQVPSFTGRIAQWDNRIVNGEVQSDPEKFSPAYMKRTPLGWLSTHLHDKDGKDELYIYGYFFKYAFDFPRGVHTLTLPNDPNIRVMAVTTVESKVPALWPTRPLYK